MTEPNAALRDGIARLSDEAAALRAEHAAIRARRHLAAFMGDCGVTSCDVCGPLRDVADEDALLDGWYSITAKDGSTAVICGECVGGDWSAVTRVDGPRDTGDERSEPCASCGDRLWLRCFTHGEACPALAADEDICDPDDD